jgi:tetratricopeptide (TPR) repeat protein
LKAVIALADDERQARLYRDNKQWSECVDLLQQVVDQQDIDLGHYHAKRLDNLCLLSWCYWMFEDMEKAERIARQALEINKHIHPEPDHYRTLDLMEKIKDNLWHQGK